MEPLDIEHLTVRFAGTTAVDGVDLHVEAGEVVALLGPSGCGKTTVLRVVAGLQEPSGGAVRLGGVDLAGVPVHRRGVGLMFQDYALFPHRDVGANVGFGLRMHGWDRARSARRVGEVLELVGLPGWERRPVGPLSGGEQQRVALARAIAPEPGVLLLDEPLGALDRTLRDRLVPELGDVFAAVGTTVVYVTHDQDEALALADRVAVMRNGSIAQIGAPRDVWTRPTSPAVARFLGFANVTDRRVVRPDAVRLARSGDGDAVGAVGAVGGDGAAGTVLGEGRVTAVTFRGERTEVVVQLDDGPLVATVPTAGASVEVGDRVVARADPSGIVDFEP
jgi:thiamine transport system ATP-binding protein